MIELLRAAAAADPDHPALITPHATYSYADMVERSEATADWLRANGVNRLGVLHDDAFVVWTALAGASLAGCEAFVLPILAPLATVETILTEQPADLVLTEHSLPVDTVSPNVLRDHSGRWTGQPPESRPLVVLTTGTTGTPKGVRHEWSRAVSLAEHLTPAPDQRWLLVYALNQFGGLQVLITVAALHGTLVTLPHLSAQDALTAIRAHGVTDASGTPTFWRMMGALLGGDTSPLPIERIVISGEATTQADLDRLVARFPGAQISQVYAATETGATFTVRDNRAGLPAEILDAPEPRFKIVDDELFTRSSRGMLGYVTDDGSHDTTDWIGTGDIVEVVDGRIEFRGRKHEVINVGGVKVSPLVIEELVTTLDDVEMAYAYGRPNAVVGTIVAVDVVARPGADQDQLRAEIRDLTNQLQAPSRPRSIKFVDQLDISGGKVRRKKQESEA